MKKSIIKKLFIKLSKIMGYEIIDQNSFSSPTLDRDLNKDLSRINEKSIVLTASDAGWINGHTYSLFGPLSIGSTTILIAFVYKTSTSPSSPMIKSLLKFSKFDSENISKSHFQPFHRPKVKIKKEVVPMGLKILPKAKKINHLTPSKWNILIKKKKHSCIRCQKTF